MEGSLNLIRSGWQCNFYIDTKHDQVDVGNGEGPAFDGALVHHSHLAMWQKAKVISRRIHASGSKSATKGNFLSFSLEDKCAPNLLGLHIRCTLLGCPVIHKVLKIRIWGVPPACLGSR